LLLDLSSVLRFVSAAASTTSLFAPSSVLVTREISVLPFVFLVIKSALLGLVSNFSYTLYLIVPPRSFHCYFVPYSYFIKIRKKLSVLIIVSHDNNISWLIYFGFNILCRIHYSN